MAQSVALATLEKHIRFIGFGYAELIRERTAGDDWLAGGESEVLRVPSAVVPGDWNYLINPEHLDFAQIAVQPPAPMRFDARLYEG